MSKDRCLERQCWKCCDTGSLIELDYYEHSDQVNNGAVFEELQQWSLRDSRHILYKRLNRCPYWNNGCSIYGEDKKPKVCSLFEFDGPKCMKLYK